MFSRALGVVVLCGALWGCDSAAGGQPEELGGGEAGSGAAPSGERDRDGDGLCDVSERRVGSDPADPDSDGDGLPDLVETGNRFDPLDSGSPGQGRSGVLQAAPGAILEFAVRATVEGAGTRLTGFFEEAQSGYPQPGGASDYFVGAEAVSADPGDHVRRIIRESETFTDVIGETRLAFILRFAYPEWAPRDCARAHPFRYIIKSAHGEIVAEQELLLVVSSQATSPVYCEVGECL